jgi:Na+/H+ antiporter NhaC
MPLAISLDLPPSLCLAAILGGGVFGDHCSPISDTTAVSAIASGCDLLEHVRTQLPYAVTAGVLAFLMYLVAGIILI